MSRKSFTVPLLSSLVKIWQANGTRKVDLTILFSEDRGWRRKGRLKWYMSNVSSPLRSHCPWPLTPYRWQIRCRPNEMKMKACWQEQGDSSSRPYRQQEWHHIFSNWHVNEFSNTWTFLAEVTFDTSRFFDVSNNRILYLSPTPYLMAELPFGP